AQVGRDQLRVNGAALHASLSRYEGRSVALGIRSESLEDAALLEHTPERCRLRGLLELREHMGSDVFAHVRLEAPPVLTQETREVIDEVGAQHTTAGTTTVVARLNPRTHAREGNPIELAVDVDGLHFFDLETGERIHQ